MMNQQNEEKSPELEVERWYSPKQVSLALGVSESSIKRWVDQGKLPCARTNGGHRKISVQALVEFSRESGYQISRPEKIGLPKARLGDRTVASVVDEFTDALANGESTKVRSLLVTLYMRPTPAAELVDDLIRPAFTAIGERWDHGSVAVYEEHRATNLMLDTLVEMIGVSRSTKEDLPQALGSTLTDDPYEISSRAAQWVVQEAGWSFTSLGMRNPASTLVQAVQTHRPGLFCLCINHADSTTTSSVQAIAEAMTAVNGRLIVGGQKLALLDGVELPSTHRVTSMRELAQLSAPLKSED